MTRFKTILLTALLVPSFAFAGNAIPQITFDDLTSANLLSFEGKKVEFQGKINVDKDFRDVVNLAPADGDEAAGKSTDTDIKTLPPAQDKELRSNCTGKWCLVSLIGTVVTNNFYPNGKLVVESYQPINAVRAPLVGALPAGPTCPPIIGETQAARAAIDRPANNVTPMPESNAKPADPNDPTAKKPLTTQETVDAAVAHGTQMQGNMFDYVVTKDLLEEASGAVPAQNQLLGTHLAGIYKLFPYASSTQWPRVAVSFTKKPDFAGDNYIDALKAKKKGCFSVTAKLWCSSTQSYDSVFEWCWPQNIVQNVPFVGITTWSSTGGGDARQWTGGTGTQRSAGPGVPAQPVPGGGDDDGYAADTVTGIALGSILYDMGFDWAQPDGRVWLVH